MTLTSPIPRATQSLKTTSIHLAVAAVTVMTVSVGLSHQTGILKQSLFVSYYTGGQNDLVHIA